MEMLDYSFQYEVESTLVGHSMTVNLAEGIYCEGSDSQTRTLVATASVDSTLKIWERKTSTGLYKSIIFKVNISKTCISFQLS